MRQCGHLKPGLHLCCLILLAMAVSLHLTAIENRLSPERLKAAYVYNFLKFTEWPAEKDVKSALVVCLVNANQPLVSAFENLNQQKANGRPIFIKQLSSTTDVDGCHVYYLREGGAPVALRNLAKHHPHLLTVGDATNFVAMGGIIGLIEKQGHLQFEINLELIQVAQYKISSQLLKLARNTRTLP
ncbi:MAG: YfiR family protein [Aeromonadaceae bacterium]